jgi:hypothetical protein
VERAHVQVDHLSPAAAKDLGDKWAKEAGIDLRERCSLLRHYASSYDWCSSIAQAGGWRKVIRDGEAPTR